MLAPLAEAISRRRIYRDLFEIGLVGVAFLLYFLVRGSVVDRDAEALGNALDIIEVERAIGIYWEPDLHAAIIDYEALVQLFNAFYFWLDFPLIVGVGLGMYFFGRRHEYTVARDAVLASGAIALIVYNLFPVAPPRLLEPLAIELGNPAAAGAGFVDTVNEYTNFSYQAQSTQPFVNPYAAMPSLHYGWQLLVGGVLFWTARSVWLRALGVFMPVGQLSAIVFTANHYILDAIGGLGVALLGLLVAIALQRWGYPAVRRLVERVPEPASSPAGPPG